MSLLLIAAALGEYSGWEATSKPRPSLAPGAPAVAGLRREAAVGAVRSTFMQLRQRSRTRRAGAGDNEGTSCFTLALASARLTRGQTGLRVHRAPTVLF